MKMKTKMRPKMRIKRSACAPQYSPQLSRERQAFLTCHENRIGKNFCFGQPPAIGLRRSLVPPFSASCAAAFLGLGYNSFFPGHITGIRVRQLKPT